MTNKIFAGFSCRQLGTDASVMNANYGSSCESDEYILVLVVCSLLTIVWAIGIPATLFWEMYKVRELITEGDPDTLQKFEFVLGDYDREHWYWEVVELTRTPPARKHSMSQLLSSFVPFTLSSGRARQLSGVELYLAQSVSHWLATHK